MFKRILIAADGSEYSFRATDKAIELVEANPEEAIFDVVYVVDSQATKDDVLHNPDSSAVLVKRNEKLKGVKERLEKANIQYEVKILHGNSGETLVEYANENDFDCVVLGSRGLNRVQSMVLGSVSLKVAKRVQCPVMIVK